MKKVNISEAKRNFSRLLARVETKLEPIVIYRNGKPIANLVPHKRANRIKTDPLLRRIAFRYDPIEALSSDEWPNAAR